MSATKTEQVTVTKTDTDNGRFIPAFAPPEVIPDVSDYITEDGKPVDNLYVEKLYKLLIDPLYVSWQPPGEQPCPFVAMSNVGWFFKQKTAAVVPDIMLSLDVTALDPGTPEGRSYFQWVYGKAPDLAIEIVSDERADEPGERLRTYERLKLTYYIIHDPLDVYGQGILRGFELQGGKFAPIDPRWIERLNLGLSMWDGTYHGITRSWLRWCDRDGKVLPTGQELAERTQESAERLRAQLRALGIEPEA